ncbi:MAG: 3,4-dihydroxy-2-butanone-4-phosphate synthase [Candidatus Thermoplasmatota archaeon]|nr:3,4-dihydroxy-2-butanone-4-phosphate synthase [Candidatus Thermoplasmatota archaeon]
MAPDNVERAIESLKDGSFALVYDADGREEECDFFLAAEFCKSEHIRTMRKEGGGLIFLMVRPDIRDKLGLPFLQDLYPGMNHRYPVIDTLIPDDIPYDTKSSFSISINHRRTFTGITDNDRALTVQDFALTAMETADLDYADAIQLFGERFRTPGHVPICLGSDRILENRFGHTELSCALSTMAGLSGVTVGCEIMGDNGRAMPKASVMEYARQNGIPFLEGKQIIDAWSAWEGEWKRTYRPPDQTDTEPSELDKGLISFPNRGGVRVMATGVFDILHPGHLSFLSQAKRLGDELVVVVARDSTVRRQKRKPINNERARREMVESLGIVDLALLGYEADPLRIVKELGPDMIVLGYDQEPETAQLESQLRERGIGSKVKRLRKRQGDIDCTTRIISRIKEEEC